MMIDVRVQKSLRMLMLGLVLPLGTAAQPARAQSTAATATATTTPENSAPGQGENLKANSSTLVRDVLRQLNELPTIRATEDAKSYKVLFDAYLQMSPPPFPIGPDFNHNTIHSKMKNWSAVAGWAESNLKMDEAIIKCKEKVIIGLPYGTENLPPTYVKAELVADIAAGGSLRNNKFGYLKAVDVIAAYCTAEIYRLMEANQTEAAINLAMAELFLLRQFCDREFLVEKLHCIEVLSDALSNVRDVFYTYLDKISAEQFTRVSFWEVPYLRPDRSRLLMPEADRIVSTALIKEVFDSATGMADPEKFASTFAEIQSQSLPLTRFGAAKRWGMIAAVHGSLDASLTRLGLIYDDWWRRWRVQEYDEILAYESQFQRTNPIRYAAVIYSMQNISSLFAIRNQLRVEVSGTALSAGICAYRKTFNTYPDIMEKVYSQFVRKSSDHDPYDKELARFGFELLKARKAIDTDLGRIWIEPDDRECVLWSVGQDHADNRATPHSDAGDKGDIVIWPPIKALSRKKGLME